MKKYKLRFTKIATMALFLCSCNLTGSKQELVEKIEKIIKPEVEKIESDKKEEELTFDEIKNVFNFVQISLAFDEVKKVFNSVQRSDEVCKDYRRQFYSSLEYNKIRITKLIEIFNKALTQKAETAYLIRSIIERGSSFVQNPIEIAILDIHKRKDDLIDFKSKEKLKDVKNKINKILAMRQQWIKNIDKIIITYNDNKNLQNNSEELETYLKTTYENILKPDSNEIYDLMIEIGRELQENL
ncbi:complement regulator-acquiring protein [Borreliella lusitaniae]|uniref:Complement regulator-acquiring protein n=1 Tax=Borreliella lusitaniae TaxID=100177 RepID=A0ABZ0CJC1_9SPIR|nr:complement regulator-acquiring protein [Borreliella lusitaniae]WNY69173.1 complement regulator-acquiring protein [Borreliella lusitaniae]